MHELSHDNQHLITPTIQMEGEGELLAANSVSNTLLNQKQQPMKKNQKQKDSSDSEWSLSSLQDLKGCNLKDIENQDNEVEDNKIVQEHQIKYPDKPTPQIVAASALHHVGKVVFAVGELLIVESVNASFVVDLDSWLCDSTKGWAGFVMDVFGRVENPFYAIKGEGQTDDFLQKDVYYLQGSSKILKDEQIKSLKAKSQVEQQDNIQYSQEEQKPSRKLSDEQPTRTVKHSKRQNRFYNREKDPEWKNHSRSRDNDRRHNNHRDRDDSNQKYLQNMYSLHYSQMMRLYNGSHQQQQTYQQRQQHEQFNSNQQGNYQQPYANQQPQNYQLFPPQNVSYPPFGSLLTPQINFSQLGSTPISNPNNQRPNMFPQDHRQA